MAPRGLERLRVVGKGSAVPRSSSQALQLGSEGPELAPSRLETLPSAGRRLRVFRSGSGEAPIEMAPAPIRRGPAPSEWRSPPSK